MGRLILVLGLVIGACANATGAGQQDAATDSPRAVDSMADGNGCATQPCSILPQCGCNGQTACDIDTSDNAGTACRSVNSAGTETSTCDSLDDCDKGYVCLGGSAFATCKKYCEANADCGTPRGRCAIDISSAGMSIADIPSACSSNCNPLLMTQSPDCPSSYKCGLYTATHMGMQVKVTDCGPAGAGTQGANCKSGSLGNDSLCAPGYLCTTVDGGTNYNCRRMCNRTANTGCVGTQMCLGFTTPHTVDIEYGVCN